MCIRLFVRPNMSYDPVRNPKTGGQRLAIGAACVVAAAVFGYGYAVRSVKSAQEKRDNLSEGQKLKEISSKNADLDSDEGPSSERKSK